METAKTFTKNVGKRNAEVTDEKIAAIILAQFANRDIYVSDVEIYEYAKRQVSFKETKGGVIIRGKKFSFDQLHGELKADDCSETKIPDLRQDNFDMSEFADLSRFKASLPPHPGVPTQMPQFNPQLAHQVAQKTTKPKQDPNVPIRQEVFRPSREDYPLLQRQGVKLTMNKPYPLFGEVIKSQMEPIYYVVQDDSGNKIELSSLYFEPMRRGLVGIGVNDPQAAPPEGRLAYVDYGSGVIDRGGVPVGGGGGVPMPTLRRDF